MNLEIARCPEDAVRDLLDGLLDPEEFARGAVPSPPALREPRASQALGWAYSSLVLASFGFAAIASLALIDGRPARDIARAAMLLLALFVLARVTQVLRLRLSSAQGAVLGGEVHSEYRRLCGEHLLLQIKRDLDESREPTPAEIQSVVSGIHGTLVRAGVSQPQVFLFRVDSAGAFVSYSAGDEPPSLVSGSYVPRLSAVAARRVVYQQAVRLSESHPTHKLVIVAACRRLSATEREITRGALNLLSGAHARTDVSTLVPDHPPPS